MAVLLWQARHAIKNRPAFEQKKSPVYDQTIGKIVVVKSA